MSERLQLMRIMVPPLLPRPAQRVRRRRWGLMIGVIVALALAVALLVLLR